MIIFLFNFVVKFVFSLFFFLPSLSYFFIYYFSLNTRTLVTSHKFPFSFSFLFSLLNFPHHIFTHPLSTRFTPTPSPFLFPSIFLFSTVHIFTGIVHSSFFPNTRSRAWVYCWVSLFLLKVSLGLLLIFAKFVEKWRSQGVQFSIWGCSIF